VSFVVKISTKHEKAGQQTPSRHPLVSLDQFSAADDHVEHGYPLRLIIPVKYGIKSIKRIGSMYFDNERPSDYWAERGYDYYSGL
jgi:DMSO/TMAO reductase YedYZ molybdopterin-dependent catalytic subunit